MEQDNASSIDYIITKLLGEKHDVAKKLRKQRIDIVHARVALSLVLKNIAENTQIAQGAVMAGILDILQLPKDRWPTFLRKMLPVTGGPKVIARAILYDFPLTKMRAQPRYPQLVLRDCQVEIPDRPMAHAGEVRPLTAQLGIGIENYTGDWNLLEVHSLIEIDPEDDSPLPEIIAIKTS